MIPNVHEQIPKFQELAPEADLYDGLKMILQAEPLKQNYSWTSYSSKHLKIHKLGKDGLNHQDSREPTQSCH